MDLFGVTNGILIISIIFYGIVSVYSVEQNKNSLYYFAMMAFFLNAGLLATHLILSSVSSSTIWIPIAALIYNVGIPFLSHCYSFASNITS